jgi:NAD(P)-dependent dehydrogenase (short-subunit alcohol dehydrogenase family)
MRFKGQVAIVTGGAHGIGEGIVRALAREGAGVAIADMDEEGTNKLAQELVRKGVNALAVAVDVSKTADILHAVEQVIAHFGHIDILVNNAGGSAYTPIHIEDVSEEDYDKVLDTNLKSTFFFTKAVFPHMIHKQSGRIVNMASASGRAGSELTSPQYSAAKAGVIGFTRNLAKHMGPYNITVNAIAPGFVKSGPRVEALWRDRDEEATLKLVALRRQSTVEEQANVVLFLCSDEASYITGATIDVNGGAFAI